MHTRPGVQPAPSPASFPQWRSLLLVFPELHALSPGQSGLSSVKVTEWRRGHSPKTPSGSNSEGRGRKENQSLFFSFGVSCPLAQGWACGGTLFMVLISCLWRLFQAERGDGYYESGVTAFSIPEGCLGTEPWMSSNEKEISILPGATAARRRSCFLRSEGS